MEHLTSANFAETIATGITLVDFYAVRCGPCKMIAPHLEQLAEANAGKVAFYKVDVDLEQEIAIQENITAMPTLKFYKDGKEVKTIIGANLPEVVSTLQELVG